MVAECWSQHDYITIGPNKISDAVARIAVRPENREKLYARTRAILQQNLPVMREWVAGFGGFLTFREPQAGALCLMRYGSTTPSYELCERIRVQPERADRARRAPGPGRLPPHLAGRQARVPARRPAPHRHRTAGRNRGALQWLKRARS